MNNILNQCKDFYGSPPRSISLWDRSTYFHIPKPIWLWLSPSDEINVLFKNLPHVFRNGVVVWGHIIQANELLFEPGSDNCPGEIVYSIEDSENVTHEYLEKLAEELYNLKGTTPHDPSLNSIASYLTDEMIRVYGLPVPSLISPTYRCQISSTFFFRKHLPNKRLCSSLIPVIVNPSKPYVVMPLPERFWPAELIKWWVE